MSIYKQNDNIELKQTTILVNLLHNLVNTFNNLQTEDDKDALSSLRSTKFNTLKGMISNF